MTKSDDHDCHSSTCLTFEKEAEFILKLSKEKGIHSNKLFPEENRLLGCAAQDRNNYVVSPNGKLHKCWEDISEDSKCVGNILSGFKDENNINSYFLLNSSGFDTPECKNCLFLYSCMGGCPRFRFNNKKAEKTINPVCSLIKYNPEEFLETYYETLKKSCC